MATLDRHAPFLALLPKLETHARIVFRYLRCRDTREDRIAEVIALAWQWFLRLHERGKDVNTFPMAFVFLVTKAVRCGRRVCGMEKSKDVLSARSQQRHGFRVEQLPATRASFAALYSQPHGQQQHDAFEERLKDNNMTPIPEHVAFRLDWPRFITTLSARDQRLAECLALGNTGKQTAQQFNLSPARVTQLRLQWCREWTRFEM